MDNASTCNVLAKTLSTLLRDRYHIHFHYDNGRVRCLAHTINLIVQAFLNSLSEADHPDVLDNFLTNKREPIHYDPDSDPDVRALEDEEEKSKINEEDDQADSDVSGDTEQLSAVKKVWRNLYLY